MKRVIVNAISLLTPRTGIARYTREVAIRLPRKKIPIEWFYWIGGVRRSLPSQREEKKGKDLYLIKNLLASNRISKGIARRIIGLLARFDPREFDLYWEPNFIPELSINARRRIVTVHDFSFYLYPQWHPKERVAFFSKNFFERIRKADHLITVSEFVKEEAREILGVPEEKITVIYNGIDHRLYHRYEREELEKTQQYYSLDKPFILFVGTIEPRKNLLRLLEAYQALDVEVKEEYSLLLVGSKGWENSKIMKEIEKERGRVRYLGSVNDVMLAHLYNLCTLFVYPSLYEGFGMPPVEAMACGAAVMVSRRASLPEVCGKAAWYVDPENVNTMREGLQLLLRDEGLRRRLGREGIEWAARYDWDCSAKEHMELFRRYL